MVVQLLGHSPESLSMATKLLSQIGVTAVNLNLACPSRRVISSGNGGGCLRDPVLIQELCSSISEACGDAMSFSVKIRTGWDSTDHLPAVVEALKNGGARWIICHTRTVQEEYRPISRTESYARLRRVVACADTTPVFGNGDILSSDDARSMQESSHCAGVAVGRGILRNPFLLEMIRTGQDRIGMEDRKCFLRRIYEIAEEEAVGPRWFSNAFLEYGRMTFGADSPEFRDLLDRTPDQIKSFLEEEQTH